MDGWVGGWGLVGWMAVCAGWQAGRRAGGRAGGQSDRQAGRQTVR